MRKYCVSGGVMKPLVCIKVIGYNLDQLINKIQNAGVTCYNITRAEHNEMLFCVPLKSYKHVKPLLKIYEYHIKYLGIANFKT